MVNRNFQIVLFALFLLIYGEKVFSQQPLNDSQKAELEQNDRAIEKATSEGDKAQAAQFLNKSAYIFWNNQIYDKAINYYKRALELISQMNNRRGMMIINYNLGMIYSDMEDYENALGFLKAGLKESRVVQENQSIVSGITNVSLALQGLERHEEALEYLSEALELATELNDLKLLRRCYGMMYESYEALGNSDKAFEYFEIYNSYDKKLKREEIEEVKSQAKTEISKVNEEKDATQKELSIKTEALKTTEDSLIRTKILTREQQMELELRELKIREADLRDRERIAKIQTQRRTLMLVLAMAVLILGFLVVLYFQFQQKKKANKLLGQQKKEIEKYSISLEETNHELEKLSIVASETDNAVIIMDAKGDYEWVNNGFTRMLGFTFDQLLEERQTNILGPNTPEGVREIIQECFTSKKTVNYELTLNSRNEKEVTVNTTLTPIIDKNGKIKKVIAIDSDISKIKAAELEILQQRDRLHKQNEQITASIRYATNIQQAILPDEKAIDKTFENFIFYRPKDMVSGDFYWYSEFEDSSGLQTTFIAAVDCTGHGVPGAFMSMIGSRLLNEIVNEKKVFDPKKILELLNNGVRLALRQDQTDNNDGMDVCLCKFELKKDKSYTVTFSGAKRPLYIVRAGEDEVITLKADRKSIGGIGKSKEEVLFTNQTIDSKKGDTFYLSSDGIIDQNGPDRKRFGSKRLLEFFKDNHKSSMNEQLDSLTKIYELYVQNEEQRDDITLLGIRLR